MGSGISLSQIQVESIIERERVHATFDDYVRTTNPYVDGYIHEDFSVEEKYWKKVSALNRRISEAKKNTFPKGKYYYY